MAIQSFPSDAYILKCIIYLLRTSRLLEIDKMTFFHLGSFSIRYYLVKLPSKATQLMSK